MESQLRRPHEYEQETHTGLHGEHDEHRHERGGIIKKVKAKAKKIKDSIKKHSHLHGHEHHDGHDRVHIPDDHDLDEEDTEEDEDIIVHDPAVHGVTSTVPGQTSSTGLPKTDLGNLTSIKEDPIAPKYVTGMRHRPTNISGHEKHLGMNCGMGTAVENEPLAPRDKTDVALGNYPYPTFPTSKKNDFDTPKSAPGSFSEGVRQERSSDPSKTFVEGQEDVPGVPKVNLERPKGLLEDPAAPKSSPSDYIASNYRSEVTDHTGQGGEEIGASPILQSFDKMNIHEKPGQKQRTPCGTEYSSPEFARCRDQYSPEVRAPSQHNIGMNIHSAPHQSARNSENQYEQHATPGGGRSNQSTYKTIPENLGARGASTPLEQPSHTDKIPSSTSAVSDKTVSAKDNLASELGHGGNEREEQRQGGQQDVRGRVDERPGSYTDRSSSATSIIADKAASAKDFVASKLGYVEKGGTDIPRKGTRMLEGVYESKHPKSYTEKISSAAAAAVPTAVTGSAISAKNAVASKLGYGSDKDDEGMHRGNVGKSEDFGTTRKPEHEWGSNEWPNQNPEFTGNTLSVTDSVPSKITELAKSAKESLATNLGYHQEKDDDHRPLANTTEHQREDSATKNATNQSGSYAEKIKSAAAAISDTAVSAKDTVASKFGYSHNGDDRYGHESATTKHPHTYYSSEKPINQDSSYAEKISSAAAAVPASIAGAAISTKDALASTLGYGTNEEKHRAYNAEELGPVGGLSTKHETVAEETDKGISVTEYLAEKSKPGKEDKALSQLISETLHADKGEEVAGHNLEVEQSLPFPSITISHDANEGYQPQRKVTVEEVTERLDEPSYDEYGEKVQASYVNAAEGGVVLKIKGAVASLLGTDESEESSQRDSSSI